MVTFDFNQIPKAGVWGLLPIALMTGIAVMLIGNPKKNKLAYGILGAGLAGYVLVRSTTKL